MEIGDLCQPILELIGLIRAPATPNDQRNEALKQLYDITVERRVEFLQAASLIISQEGIEIPIKSYLSNLIGNIFRPSSTQNLLTLNSFWFDLDLDLRNNIKAALLSLLTINESTCLKQSGLAISRIAKIEFDSKPNEKSETQHCWSHHYK